MQTFEGIFWNDEEILRDNFVYAEFTPISYAERKEMTVELFGVEGEIDVSWQLSERPLFNMRAWQVPILVRGARAESEIDRIVKLLYNAIGYQKLRFIKDNSLNYLAKTKGKPTVQRIAPDTFKLTIELVGLPKQIRTIDECPQLLETCFVETDPIELKCTLESGSHTVFVPKGTQRITITPSPTGILWNGLTINPRNNATTIETRLWDESTITLTGDETFNLEYGVGVL